MITRHLLPFSLLLALLPTTPGCTSRGPSENPSVETRVQTGHAAPVSSWRFSPDGRYLLTGASRARKNVWILWDTQTGTQLRTRYGWICDLSPDGSLLLIHGPNQGGSYEVVLESTTTGRVVHTLLSDTAANIRPPILFARDGRHVVLLGGGDNRYVWDTATGKPVYQPGMPLPYSEEESKRLRERAESGEPKISRERVNDLSTLLFLKRVLPDGKPLLIRDAILTDNYAEVSFSPDGSRMAGREWYNTEEDTDETVIWDVHEAVPLHRLCLTNRRPSKLFFTPDGRYIVYGIGTKTIRLLDSRTFNVVHEFEGHDASVMRIAVSPDGKRILGGMSDGRAVLWDRESGRRLLTTGKERDKRRHSFGVKSLAFSPDGSRFLVGQGGSRKNKTDVWNSRCIEVFDTNTGNRRLIVRGDELGNFNNDGSKIATETALRDAETGKRSLLLATRFPHRIEMSPSGRWAFCCLGLSFSQQRELREEALSATVWDTKTARQVHSFEGGKEYRRVYGSHQRRETQIPSTSTSDDPVYGPNYYVGPRLVHGQLAWETREMIAQSKKLDAEGKEWLSGFVEPCGLKHLDHADFQILMVSPSGRTLATKRTRTGACPVELRTSDGEILHSLESDNWTPTGATFSQDEAQLLVACSDDHRDFWLTLWDTKTGKKIRTVAAPRPESKYISIRRLTLSPDGRYAALCVSTDSHIDLVDLETGESFPLKGTSGPNDRDLPVFFSPDSKLFYCFRPDHTLWNVAGKEQLLTFESYDGRLAPIFSPDGKVLLVRTSAHGKEIRNAESANVLHRFPRSDVFFNEDGTRLIAIGSNYRHATGLWDFHSGKEICDLSSNSPAAGRLRDVFFTPETECIVTTYEHALATWDTKSGKRLTSFADETLAFDHRRNQQRPFFLSDGKRFVTVHSKGAVVWDLETGKPIHRFPTPINSKTEAILAPEGEKLLVVTRGREATLWDLNSGEAVQTFSPLPPDTEKVWFGDDGTRFFSRHQGGRAVFMWDVPSGEVEAEYYLLGDGDKWLTVHPRTGTAVGATEYLHKISRKAEQ